MTLLKTAPKATMTVAYPVMYRYGLGVRILWGLSGGVLIFIALSGLAHGPGMSGGQIIRNIVLPCLLLAVGLAFVFFQLTWRLKLTQDAIETSNWWIKHRLRRDEIKGYTTYTTAKSGRSLILVPAVASLKKIVVPLGLMQKDAALFAWFSGTYNLDVADTPISLAEIAAEAGFGASRE
jgi:hypothetical protein